MKLGTPTWSEKFKETNSGIDLLGVSMPFMRIQSQFIPILTGATRWPRYYSFLCWVIYRFHGSDLDKTYKNWQEFLFKYESIFILATKWHHRLNYINGVQGTNGMLKMSGPMPAEMAIGSRDLERTSAWLPAAYKPSFAGLHLVHYESGKVPSLITEIGTPLALSFESSLGTDLANDLRDTETQSTTHVTANLVERFSERGCLCGHNATAAESGQLVEAIVFSKTVEGNSKFGLALSSSFELFLEMAEQGLGISEPDYFDELIFRNGHGDDIQIQVPDHLGSTFTAWRILGLRAFQQYSLELLWACLHENFSNANFGAGEIRILSRQTLDSLRDLPSEWGISYNEKMTVGDVRKELSRILVTQEARNNFPSFSSKNALTDLDLFFYADEKWEEKNFIHAINGAAVLLLSTVQRAQSLNAGIYRALVEDLCSKGGVYSLGINQVIEKVEELADKPWDEFIAYLLETWGIGKHLWTASMKFAERGISTFRFEVTEDGYKPRGKVWAQMTNSKVGTIMSLCENLGLVEKVPAQSSVGRILVESFKLKNTDIYRLTKYGEVNLELLRKRRNRS